MLQSGRCICQGLKVKAEKVKLNIVEIGRDLIIAESEALDLLSKSIGASYKQAIELLQNTKSRVILSGVGKSGHIGKKISATLSSTGTPSLFIHPSEAAHGDLGMITENDSVILISNSGETKELEHIIAYCKRYDIKIISITRNAESSLAKASTVTILMPNVPEAAHINAPTTSAIMTLALGDAIAVTLSQLKGFDNHDFKILHPSGQIGAQLLKVSDIMHSGGQMPLIKHDALGINALAEMNSKRLGCVGVINEDGELIGIFTDGDIRRHIDADFRHVKISEIMSSSPKTIESSAFASEALHIMNNKSITNLFVIEGTKPVGVVHMHDILKAKVM